MAGLLVNTRVFEHLLCSQLLADRFICLFSASTFNINGNFLHKLQLLFSAFRTRFLCVIPNFYTQSLDSFPMIVFQFLCFKMTFWARIEHAEQHSPCSYLPRKEKSRTQKVREAEANLYEELRHIGSLGHHSFAHGLCGSWHSALISC